MTDYDWPWEIKDAIAALDSDTEWDVLGAAVDGQHTFDELTATLDADADSIEQAVTRLTRGGLITRKSLGDPTDRQGYYIELSEYGSRFVEAMFETLGDATAPSDQ